MPFGYMPNKIWWKDMALKILGYPSMIRRIQAPVIMRMLSLRESDIVLDAGCGSGFFTYEIARKCQISVGIDLALDEKASFIMSCQPKLVYLRGDVQKLPFASEKFDKILLSSVLQMVEDDKALLRECNRVLKKGKWLILSIPVEYHFINGLNAIKLQLKSRFASKGKGYYDINEIRGCLSNEGFRVIESEYSPKMLGSLIFEIGLYLWYRFNFPFFHPFLFPIFYSIAYFDRFLPKNQIGDELVIKARKL